MEARSDGGRNAILSLINTINGKQLGRGTFSFNLRSLIYFHLGGGENEFLY